MKRKDFVDRIHYDIDEHTKKEALKKIAKRDEILQNKTYKNVQRREDLVVHIRENIYGKRKVVQAQFKTMGCRMKRLGSCWNCNYGVSDHCLITPKTYINTFRHEVKNRLGDVLVLESLGSITDSKEFDQKTLKEIISIAVNESDFNYILIETHITQIYEELLEYINNVNKGKKNIGFEIGLEDINPDNRKLINKIGVDNSRLLKVYEMLQKYGINLELNLIYGFPFMNEQERVNSVIESIKYISSNLPKSEIVLFLMSIKENTIMEEMSKKGFYQSANPWGLVEVTKYILEDNEINNLITFSWFGEKEDPYIKEETCYTCSTCKNQIITFFNNINGTFSREERKKLLNDLLINAKKSECKCYQRFQEHLMETDGKDPRNQI